MLKKITSVLIILAMLCTVLCACGDDDSTVMVMPIDSDPLTLDPQAADTDSGRLIASNLYEGLVRLDENYQIVPGAAEKWEISGDGLTYTFHLREDAKWQLLKSYEKVLPDPEYMKNFDNRVTAQDFVFGLQRAVDPVTQCDEAEKFLCMKNAQKIQNGEASAAALGIYAKDDKTLVIELERANPDFIRVLTLPAAMPCKQDFFKETHAKYGLEVKYTFCNGPYYVSNWAEDNTLTLIKSEVYKGNSKVNPDYVYFYVNKSEESVVSKFKQHSYSCIYLNDSTYSQLKDSKSTAFLTADNTVSGLCFNCSDNTLVNADIRKALVRITKFDEITKPDSASGNAGGIVPDCCRFGEKSYRETAGSLSAVKYDKAEALALWEKGIKEIGAESLEIKIICTDDYTRQMQKTIQNWQIVLGTAIIAKVETRSKEDFNTAVKNGKYQIAVGSVSTDSSTAVDTLKKFRSDSRANIFGYNNEAYDKLVDEIILNASGLDIITKHKQAEQMLVDDAVFCPLHTYSERIAVNSDITGLYPSPAFEGIFFLNGVEN